MASAVTQRYREADTIQAQRVAAKPRDFASVLSAEPSVVATIGRNTVAPPLPGRPTAEAVAPPRAVSRTVLPSPALARRSAAAYEAAASIGRPPGFEASGFGSGGSGAEVSAPYGSGVSIEC